MNVEILKTADPINKVSKKADNLLTVNANWKDGTDILSPVLTVSTTERAIIQCNYVYIPEFGRFYFAEVRNLRSGFFEISCTVDPLNSWKNDILPLECVVARQEKAYNLYLNDDAFRVYQNPDIITKKFPKGFDKQSFVLTVAGS